MKLNPKKIAFLKETFETAGTALILALIVRSFIIQPFKIPTGSMEETLMPGDRILVSRFSYGLRIPFTLWRFARFQKPQRGDIIVFNYPDEPSRAFIKRCIGLPGDKLEIVNGGILINGVPFKKHPVNSLYYYNYGKYGQEGKPIVVPKKSYFVLGDNSASSKDSRYWGFLDDKYLIGQALLIYWPPRRLRLLK